jgi:hypothetical protein
MRSVTGPIGAPPRGILRWGPLPRREVSPESGLCFGLLSVVAILGLGTGGWAQEARRATVTSVVINEIMASNNKTLADPQGEYDDWIELYNRAGEDLDLGGCSLTDSLDDPQKWQIPPGTVIAAYGYLLIWADGQVGNAGLHANFRLDAEGEEVGFFAPGRAAPIDSVSFGPQYADVSYGRVPDGGTEWQAIPSPTPGAANVVLYEGIVEAPRASAPTGFLSEPITLTLTTSTPDATIYFSLDGSDPLNLGPQRMRVTGSGGAVYTGPVRISRSATLKAVATKAGWRQSDVTTARYIFLGSEVQDFNSPLPLAVIDTMGQNVTAVRTPAFACFVNTDAGGRAALTGPTDFVGPTVIEIRGQSSGGFPKKQYHFETLDEQGNEKDVSILGFAPESDWILQGMYADKSLMRNVLAYQWSNEMGQWAAHTRFIELFLNTDGSDVTMADYIGVYVFMEKIKIGPSRVDITPLQPSDYAEPEVSGGYIIAKDKTDGPDQVFYTSRGLQLVYKDPKGPDLTLAQKNWIRSYMNTFEAVLYGGGFADPVDGYAKYIDAASFIDNHILVELTKNIDGFRLSTYYHKDRNGKLVMGPVWDYDLSLGNANYLDGWNATGWYYPQLGDGDYPYWRRLFEDPVFKLHYADRWFSLRRDLFATSRLLGIVEGYATLLDEPAARNYDRWRTLGIYVWPNWYIAKTYREEITWMKNWIATRLTWMDGQIATDFAPAPPSFHPQGGPVPAGFELTMSASGPIYYTLDGTDPYDLAGPLRPPTSRGLVARNAAKHVLVPTGPVDNAWRGGGAFDDSDWLPVPGGSDTVGFASSVRGGSRLSLDLKSRMYGLQTSCYVRVPFTFTGERQNLVSLVLNVQYNDGFIAYLNGVEIARRNFTGVPAWNSAASAAVSTAEGQGESIQVISFAAALRSGDNVLALQALNVSLSSPDLLIAAELLAEESGGQPALGPLDSYSGPLRLSRSTQVRARALVGGRWSAMNDAVFAVGPIAESLRISEIMYHPPDTGNPDDPNTEYIELVNIGAEPIDLNLVRFRDGIDFAFPDYWLPPSGCCLVVKDRAAFEARYGPDLPIAGQYVGSLSNSGERLVLQDAAGRTIHDFTYRDDWCKSTDGRGFSLTVSDPFTVAPDALDEAATWRPSTHPGGSPGQIDHPHL